MTASPLPPAEPVEDARHRRVVLLEDALILVCIGLLWLPIAGLRGPLTSAVLLADLALMIWLLLRRKRRVDELFDAMRRQQEEGAGLSPYPGIPGMMPPVERLDEPVTTDRRGPG